MFKLRKALRDRCGTEGTSSLTVERNSFVRHPAHSSSFPAERAGDVPAAVASAAAAVFSADSILWTYVSVVLANQSGRQHGNDRGGLLRRRRPSEAPRSRCRKAYAHGSTEASRLSHSHPRIPACCTRGSRRPPHRQRRAAPPSRARSPLRPGRTRSTGDRFVRRASARVPAPSLVSGCR